jgi:hypothetical protein
MSGSLTSFVSLANYQSASASEAGSVSTSKTFRAGQHAVRSIDQQRYRIALFGQRDPPHNKQLERTVIRRRWTARRAAAQLRRYTALPT